VTSDPDFKVTTFLKSTIGKMAKLLLYTNRKLWNGAMFGDLEWPLKASRGFVSIGWASSSLYSSSRKCCTTGRLFSNGGRSQLSYQRLK